MDGKGSHFLASCMMTREHGEFLADALGWMNEERGDWFHNQECGERAMDDFNNEYGRKCGRSANSTEDCVDKCMGAVMGGQLKTYTPGRTAGYRSW